MKTSRVPESRCLHCGRINDGATSLTKDVPEPGNVTVCIECGHIMVFADDMTMRAPTDEEMHDIAGAENVLMTQRLVDEFRRWRDANRKARRNRKVPRGKARRHRRG